MLSSEHLALQKIQSRPEPTIHVDAFLYDEDFIDSLCEEGKMSRNYCTVLHADICTQGSLLQNADVVIMNNVFEYFLDEAEQARAWEYISHNIRKQGSLLLTVPSLEESLSGLQINIQLSPWVEEVPLNYDVFPEKDIDREALEQIHLYKIL
uniref:CheR-type methyltransferase domain-containing protein n=1 Tax=Rousettus aegyptiacus TaxID=9407 RepID=A0A7J8ILM3_ROUAE|nr:hypothetical protein HJG63_010668 [Rousettus aegyptiacus]